jgi:glycosyltransferase involved in cell wall biosynthesis
MKILFVAKIDPWCSGPCGIRGYSFGLLKPFVKRKIDITIIGSSVAAHYVKDPRFLFVNIVKGYQKLSKLQVFFDIALYLKSFVLKHRGFFSDYDIIHVQRIDHAIPFVFMNKPVICTLHGKASEQALDKHGIIIYNSIKIIERVVLSRIDFAIAVSSEIEHFYTHKFPWISDKIMVINNGVDTEVFKPVDKSIIRKKFGFDQHEKIILYTGRFHKEKNLNLLISSFDYLINSGKFPARLVLVGEGETSDQILDLIREKNLESNVSILKPVADTEVPEIIGCADVLGLSSITEGFPLVILQALACDIPVVSTDVGEVSKVVINDVTGFIVQDFSCVTFADCLKNVLMNPDKFRGNCVAIARNYTWETVADKTIDIYQNVITKRSPVR